MATATEQERLTHIIRRRFSADGQALRPGQCVDASSWRTQHKLVNQRRMEPIPDRVTPVQSKDGRWWERDELARAVDAALGDEVPDADEEAEAEEDAEAFPKKLGRGRYLLSSGDEFRGSKAKAENLEAELQAKS